MKKNCHREILRPNPSIWTFSTHHRPTAFSTPCSDSNVAWGMGINEYGSILPTFAPGLRLLLVKASSLKRSDRNNQDWWQVTRKGSDLGLKVKQGAVMVSLNPEVYQKCSREEAAKHVIQQGVLIPGPNLTSHFTIPNCKLTLRGFKTQGSEILEW